MLLAGAAAPACKPVCTLQARKEGIAGYSRRVQHWPEVVACHAMTGDMDYLLPVHVEDMAHFSRFMMDTLLRHPAVLDVRSSFALQQVKETTALPLG